MRWWNGTAWGAETMPVPAPENRPGANQSATQYTGGVSNRPKNSSKDGLLAIKIILGVVASIIVLGVLALVAVPSFVGTIEESPSGEFMAEQTAASIARDANALAGFNAAIGRTNNSNIDDAVAEAGLSAAEGWTVDTSFTNGAEISLFRDGKTYNYCIGVAQVTPSEFFGPDVSVVQGGPSEFDDLYRAVAARGECP